MPLVCGMNRNPGVDRPLTLLCPSSALSPHPGGRPSSPTPRFLWPRLRGTVAHPDKPAWREAYAGG